MIKHNRNPEPPLFQEDIIRRLKNKADHFYQEEQDMRIQKRSRNIEENLNVEEEILRILQSEFNHKCAFCDQNIVSSKLTPTVHRFRPRRSARNLDDTISSDHYFWYEYDWENLYLSCNECNEHKSTFFPVDSKRAEMGLPIEDVDQIEKRFLLDPCLDDPEEHFYYEEDGMIKSITGSGQITIDIFKLNRPHLLDRRMHLFTMFQMSIRSLLPKVLMSSVEVSMRSKAIDSTSEFLGLTRFIAKRFLANNPKTLRKLTKEKGSKAELEALLNWKSFVDIKKIKENLEYIEEINVDEDAIKKKGVFPAIDRTIEFVELHSIDIHHFKNITDLYFEFPKDTSTQTSWSFFLGENGSGKSSIIQAITLALIGEKNRKELSLNPKEFLQRGKQKCTVKLETNQGTYNLVITAKGIEGTKDATSTFVLGYGSTRLMASISGINEQDHSKPIKVGNLFSPIMGLVDAKKWLLSLDRNTFNLVSVVLKEVLNLTKKQLEKDREGKIIRKAKEIFFNEPGKPSMELASLSDGYKILIALVCDICRSINEVLSDKAKSGALPHRDFELVHGIVLLDELGNHLHPRWKMRIVTALRTAFKSMRFIVSSHEPLCLRGLNEGEVMVLEYEDHNVNLLDELPDPSTYRIDQILTSPFFGLYSAIDPEVEEDFQKYYRLLRKGEDLTGEEKIELAQLSKVIRKYNIMGNSLREELAYYAVDKLLAKQQSEDKLPWSELNDHAVSAVEQLWATYKDEL